MKDLNPQLANLQTILRRALIDSIMAIVPHRELLDMLEQNTRPLSTFAAKISNIDSDFLLTQVAEEFYTAKSTAFVGPVTASYELKTANGVTQSYSGIDGGTGVDFLLENNYL